MNESEIDTVETARLILRRFTVDDVEGYFPLVSDPIVNRYTGQALLNREQARQTIIDAPLRDYARFGFGRMAVIEKASGEMIGFSGLKYLPDQREVDVGYRFVQRAWGKGYATESARTLMNDGHARFGIKRFVGVAHAENLASIAVLEKLGLRYERVLDIEGLEFPVNLYVTPNTTMEDRWQPSTNV